MSKVQLGILAVLVGAGIIVPVVIQSRFQTSMHHEVQLLRQQTYLVGSLTSENLRLSNLLAQARLAQSTENDQLQELFRLRAEVRKLKAQTTSPLAEDGLAGNQLAQIAQLQVDVEQLSNQDAKIEELREEIRLLRETAAGLLLDDPLEQEMADAEDDDPLSIRTIRTEGDRFAERLKESVAAVDDETFQEVFGRFLQQNGVQTNSVAAAVYDERTGRVIVRASESTLDQIETLTRALDQAP